MKIVMVKDIDYADQLILPVSINSEEWQGQCMMEGLKGLRKKRKTPRIIKCYKLYEVFSKTHMHTLNHNMHTYKSIEGGVQVSGQGFR